MFSGFKSLWMEVSSQLPKKKCLPVNDVVLMAIADSWEDLFHGLSGEFFVKIRIWHVWDFIKKFASIIILTDNIKIFFILEEFKHFHHIRVILKENLLREFRKVSLTIIFKILNSLINISCCSLHVKDFLMILTALVTLVWRWIALLTSPKAPIKWE